MKGHNHYSWLKSGETEVCGKSCLWEHFKIHLAKIRKGCKVPVPCRSCAKGVQSDYVGRVGGKKSVCGKKRWSGKLE